MELLEVLGGLDTSVLTCVTGYDRVRRVAYSYGWARPRSELSVAPSLPSRREGLSPVASSSLVV
jgi:hypothetical protein